MARAGTLHSIDFRPDAIPGDAALVRPYRVEVEEGWNPAIAEALWPRAGTASIFNHPAWWGAAIESYGAGRRILGVTVRVDGQVCGYWPFWEKRMGAKDGFARIIEPVGSRLTDYVMPLIANFDDRLAVCAAMLEGLKRRMAPDVLLLWPKADRTRCASSSVAAAFPTSRYLVHRLVRRCPRMTLPGSYEALTKRWSGNHRSQLRRRERRLGEMGELAFHVAQMREEILGGLQTMFAIHRVNWNERGGGSEFDDPANEAFVKRIAEGLPMELLHYSELRLDGKAISCNFDFRLDDEILFYKGAFDIAYSRFSPGMVHTAKVSEWAIAQGIHTLDFMQGEEDYKYLWADSVRETVSHAISPIEGLPVWLWNTKFRKMIVEFKV